MASAQRGDKVVHQDYIARIRYSNALPPPPHPPKLLEIPGTGLSGGQYTSAAYASRLAREQPLSVEVDAELGMPIDLVGIPGVFEGDDSAISVRPGPPNHHPADKALLRPLAALSKAGGATGAVSFLRRTEYTSSQNTQHFTSSTSKDLLKLRNDAKKKKATVNKDDPINIMRDIVKGFDVAYPKDAYKGEDSTTNLRGAQPSDAELSAWKNPKHPTNPDLKLLDSYPVLPDPEAIPTTGFFLIMKFITNPIGKGGYDERLDTAIVRPVIDEDAEVAFSEKLREWEESRSTKPEPIREYDYDYYLPENPEGVRNLKRKLDVNDPENEDPALYTDEVADDQMAFKYKRLRTYETYNQHGDVNNLYNDTVALALHDPETEEGHAKRLAKGAYFYPIVQRTGLRPKRVVGSRMYDQQEKIDELNVMVTEPNEDLQASQMEKRAMLDPALRVGGVV
ncbi:RNA polymerase ii-associated like protein [Zymoseptoria brevis]|uniref:RNA polymerase ii-associated like protein n=1 Tax=Zymoseptoria brevis TaxID=1047168 RepID=A0A0F4GLK0_9PEZI|nr:RNA polymerase ii-associated like protein [Zymoseptoria brevis]